MITCPCFSLIVSWADSINSLRPWVCSANLPRMLFTSFNKMSRASRRNSSSGNCISSNRPGHCSFKSPNTLFCTSVVGFRERTLSTAYPSCKRGNSTPSSLAIGRLKSKSPLLNIVSYNSKTTLAISRGVPRASGESNSATTSSIVSVSNTFVSHSSPTRKRGSTWAWRGCSSMMRWQRL